MTATSIPAVPVDLGLYPELQRYGATDISACFSCGTCTASCPLSQTDATFPRRIIRYAQVGMKDALLSSKELWSCYQCGECAETCPTQADPSEFMAATRRYAIASYDRTRIARTMYTRPIVATVFAVVLAVFFALFMYSAHGPQDAETLAIFEFIPEELIHNLGIVVMIVVVLAGLAGVASMARAIARREGVGLRSTFGSRAALGRTGRAAWDAIGRESLGQVALPRGVRCGRPPHDRWIGRLRPCRPVVPPALARPRGHGLGLPRACSPRPASTTGSRCSASRRPARRSRSGTRSGCSGPSRARCSSTA